MPIQNTRTVYGSVAKLFHWVIFLLIATLVAMGFKMIGLPNGPDKFWVIGLHKSFGITVLSLAVLRLSWKLANVTPLLPNTINWWQKYAAHAVHFLLYALMFLMPLSGWAMSSASGFSVSVYGWFTLPNLVAPNKELKEFFVQAHYLMAWTLIALVTAHIMAALLHHFYYKDNVLVRMLPFTKPKEDSYARSDTMAGC